MSKCFSFRPPDLLLQGFAMDPTPVLPGSVNRSQNPTVDPQQKFLQFSTVSQPFGRNSSSMRDTFAISQFRFS